MPTQIEIDNIIASSGNFTTATASSGNFTSNVQIGTNNLTSNDVLNIINSANLYLWSTFR